MQPLQVGDYEAAEVEHALTTSGRHLRFRFERLAGDNTSLGFMNNVEAGSCTITHNYLREVKRTCQVTLVELPGATEFDFANDRLRPWVGVKMPDGGWAEWAQGVFLLSSPTVKNKDGIIVRECDGYDQTIALSDEKFAFRAFALAGAAYTSEVDKHAVAIPTRAVTLSAATIPSDMTWDPGVTKYRVVADLLQAINYDTPWFDGMGAMRAGPYVNPADAAVSRTYESDMMVPGISRDLDLFQVPNRIVMVVSKPSQPVLVSEWVNRDPASPTSVQARGRVITYPTITADAATQAELDGLVRRAGINAANIYETTRFESYLMPLHENRDVLWVSNPRLGVAEQYAETEWSMELKPGGKMKHKVRRVVNITASLVGEPVEIPL